MSSRHFRKRVGTNALPPPAEDSDGDYEPLFVQRSSSSAYAGLVLSQSGSDPGSPAQSDKEKEEDADKENDDERQDCAAAMPCSSDKKKSRRRGKKKGRKPVVSDDFDEIDRSVQEVNAILGAPSPIPYAAASVSEPKPTNWALTVLHVEAKHLNVANELRKLFGPEEPEQNRRSRGGQHRAPYLLLKRVMVRPNKDTTMYEFKNSGISMNKYKDINDRMYFIYIHDENYQKMHRAFLVKYANAQGHTILMHLDEARKNMHVEALLEISDMLFRMEENNVANDIIENVATYLQYVAHSLFVPTNSGVRLEYRFMENRPFHVVMLKYMYLLSNKACHRTALEIAKMLLILDPCDPLAVLSVIDSLALRAREFEWLIEVVKYFDKQREAGLLFNIKYSNALAHYHVAVKKKEDLADVNKLIQDAIMSHPEVYMKIMDYCNVADKKFLEHPIFTKGPQIMGTPGLEELFNIYVKMSGPRWREPPVVEWLQMNLHELFDKYNNSDKVKQECKDYGLCRVGLFQVWPPEYLRHISVLSSISKLVLDEPLSGFNRPTCAWDPLFDTGVNRYNYTYHASPPPNVGISRNAVYRFFHSMLPSTNFEPEPPVND